MLSKFSKNIKNYFCFFNEQISQKYGKKCCRYNQNGIPLSIEKVQQTHFNLKQFLTGWKIKNQGKKLVKHYYVEDYPKGLQFITEVVKIDQNSFKQCPTYKLQNGEMLTLQLYSISLQGLSMIDFHLAMTINNINHSQYYLMTVNDQENYKKQVNKMRMERQSKKIQQMLEEDQKNWKKQQASRK